MKSLEKQIQELELELDTFSKSEKRLLQLNEQLNHVLHQKGVLDKKAEKEYQDVLNLKKKSFLDIFVDMHEEKEKQLEKEREEYYQALLNFKKQEKAIEAIQFEIGILREKLKNRPDKEKELARLIRQKPVVPLNPEAKEKLRKLEKITILKNKLLQSIHKAKSSIENQQVHYAEVDNHLQKINTWGLWDLPAPEKNKIFRTEFGYIFKAVEKQNMELPIYKSELEHLWSLEKTIDLDFQTKLEDLESGYQKLKTQIERFAENILAQRLSSTGLRQQVVKISAHIKSLDAEMDQEILHLNNKKEGIESELKELLLHKKQLSNRK